MSETPRNEPETLTLSLDGMQLAARAWGPADGAPVLAVHGWLDNAASFDRLVPLLPPSLRLVAIDLPGHGLSSHRAPDAHQHFIDYIPVVFRAADALGWQRFAILGHSMGGGIGALCAGTLPDRVTRLVAIEGLGPLTATADEAPERVARYIGEHLKWSQDRTAKRAPRPYATVERAVEVRMRQPHAPLEREVAELLVRRGTEPTGDGSTAVSWRHDPRVRITSMLRLTEDQVEAFLSRIVCPVLAIAAEQGWPYPEEDARRRMARVARLTLLTLPGNHHLHLNTPEVLAGPIGDFLCADQPARQDTP